MASRAIWKGIIRFGAVELPVRLLSAVEGSRVRFRLLCREDGSPIEQRWYDPETEEVVPKQQVRKAAVLPDGRLVEIDKEDLESLEPPPARDIEIVCFVPIDAIEPPYFERPYYLGPDTEGEGHAALIQVLADRRLAGIARWVMRKRNYLGAITSDGSYLALSTLRPTSEVVSADSLPAPEAPAAKKKEIELARRLVDSLEGPFNPSEFSDVHTEKILELVEQRARKHTVRAVIGGRPTKPRDESLEELLSKSLKPKPKARRTRGQKRQKKSA